MTPAEVAAYVGAAAWLPQIAAWLYRAFVNPKIIIVPDAYAEVGFTSLGPIFNVRLAFDCERKGAVIDGFELQVRHEDGDTRVFRWAGLSETFSEIRDNAGNRQVVSRDQTPIALKIGTESLVEKFVRFQEPRYQETIRPAFSNLLAQFNFLKRSGDAGYVQKVLESKELFELSDVRAKSFWWKPGCYSVTVKLSSPRKFELKNPRFSFHLTPIDVDQLKQNVDTMAVDLCNVIQSNLPDFQAQPINWNWANVSIQRVG